MQASEAQTRTPVFYGWRVVAAVFVLAIFGWGLGFYGPPVYLHAVRAARGWSLALVSSAVTTHYLAGALIVANLPRIYRHLGVATVTKLGAVALSCGVVGWAYAQEPWQLFVATIVSGMGWAATGAAAVNAIVAIWFARKRPTALSAAYNGASIGGVIFSPLWGVAIEALGFPLAATLIGAVTIVSVWILSSLYFAKTPEAMDLALDGDPAAAPNAVPTAASASPPAPIRLWRDRRFLTLSAGMALGLFAQIGLLAHLYSLLVPGLGVEWAGVVTGLATVSAITGRTLVGWLLPANADRRLVSCMAYAIQISGSLVFLLANGETTALLILGVLLFGSGIGNATSLPPLIAQAEFASGDVPRVVSGIVAISQATYAFAPAAFGLLRDPALFPTASPQSAPQLFIAAALIQALTIAIFLYGRRRR